MYVFLVGYMGSGKTTVGSRLAQTLNWSWADTDGLLEKRGRSVAEIIGDEGEGRFRVLEADCLRSALTEPKMVISTGGGTPCFNDNMAWMREHGLVIYLKADAQLLAKRLNGAGEERPLLNGLQGAGLEAHIAQQLSHRHHWYEQADMVWDAAWTDVEMLAAAVLSWNGLQSR
jgi:shikimate kinase